MQDSFELCFKIMKFMRLAGLFLGLFLSVGAAFSQIVVIHDPASQATESELDEADSRTMEEQVLPGVRKKLVNDTCTDSYTFTGAVSGAFSRAGAKQTLVFYQFCETGNGLGWVGITLLEGGKAVRTWVADSGWAYEVTRLPDINANGLDEFTLAYSGGMHQGQGGIGIDVVEFVKGAPRGIGWFHAEAITDTESDWGYKVTVKKGKIPVFYRQKYRSTEGSPWMKIGKNMRFALKKTTDTYIAVK
jgi:hypothetical protein